MWKPKISKDTEKNAKVKFVDFLISIPTTNLRVIVTLIVFLGTGIKYWSETTWQPSIEWLGFLLSMSGVDALQYFGKRKTTWHPATLPENLQNKVESQTTVTEEKG